ncbi:MAG: hypothetical protein WEB58_10250 [Planctomycetaceae bacterium]
MARENDLRSSADSGRDNASVGSSPSLTKATLFGFVVGAIVPVFDGLYLLKTGDTEWHRGAGFMLIFFIGPILGGIGAAVAATIVAISRRYRTNAAFIGFFAGSLCPVLYGISLIKRHYDYVASLPIGEASCAMSVLLAVSMIYCVAPLLGVISAAAAAMVAVVTRRFARTRPESHLVEMAEEPQSRVMFAPIKTSDPIKWAIIVFSIGVVASQVYGFITLEHAYDNVRFVELDVFLREADLFKKAWRFILLSPAAGVIAAALAKMGVKILRR